MNRYLCLSGYPDRRVDTRDRSPASPEAQSRESSGTVARGEAGFALLERKRANTEQNTDALLVTTVRAYPANPRRQALRVLCLSSARSTSRLRASKPDRRGAESARC
jgi:hypothetical protein